MPIFNVLCQIDAFANYVAEVEAQTADEAAELAYDNHSDYKWIHDCNQEFDNRIYFTLDTDGVEIESTRQGRT